MILSSPQGWGARFFRLAWLKNSPFAPLLLMDSNRDSDLRPTSKLTQEVTGDWIGHILKWWAVQDLNL